MSLIPAIWFALGFQSSLPAAAHPLDEYYQVTYITIAPNRINLAVELYPSVLIAPQILSLIDANQDDEISPDEQQAYISLFTGDVIFEVDDNPTSLQPANIEFPPALDIRGGGGVIRFTLYADLPLNHRGGHQLYYQNNHLPEIGVYLVNALSDAPALVQITKQDKDVFQTSMRLNYTIAPNAPVENEPPAEPVTDAPPPPELASFAGQERLTRYLYDPQVSPFFMVVVLGAALVLGGLHALTPGHGKTLVAAYLIGSRGTVKHAVFLGGIVTFTHTASVIIIGLLALLASQFLVPNVFVPVLEIASGLLVVYLGVQLLWTRWREYKHEAHHHHSAGRDHSHPHDHDHHHHLPEGVKLRDLLALGISGGLVPCPEALGIMLIAIGLNRITMGLGMVVAFSFGLAAVLIVIGVLLVRAKSLLDRWGAVGSRWQTLLPIVSAVIVTLLGLGIVLKGLWPI